MTPISAVILTYNEEKNISRCLDSLRHVVDEIIVVDAHSEDRTAEICRSKGARVFPHDWQGYMEARNFGHSCATHRYILWLDADEALSDRLQHSILKARSAGLSGAYLINRLNNHYGRWLRFGGYYPDRKIRIYPRDKAIWQGRYVHEQLVLKETLPVHHLEGDILHYSYKTPGEHLKKARHYARLGALKLLDEHKKFLFLKAILSPVFRFFKGYFLKLGFLEGYAGFMVNLIDAYGVHLKYRIAVFLQIKGVKYDSMAGTGNRAGS